MYNTNADVRILFLAKYTMIIFLAAMLLPPEGISVLAPSINTFIFRFGRRIGTVIIIMLFSMTLRRRFIDTRFDLFIFFMLFYLFFVTVFKGGSLEDFIKNYSNVVLIQLLLFVFRNQLPDLLRGINIYLIIINMMNLISIIFHPAGMYINEVTKYSLNWLFGYKSSFQYYVFPCLVISWLEYEYGKMPGGMFILILLGGLFEAVSGSNVMLAIAVIILLIKYVLSRSNIVSFSVNSLYFWLILLANILIIHFTDFFLYSRVGTLFLQYTHRRTNLGGRVNRIWPVTLQYIKNNPIFGVGVQSAEINRNIYGMIVAIHAHNQLLEFAYIGGYILLIMFLTWLYLKLNKTAVTKQLKSSMVIGFSIFVSFLMVTVEVFSRSIGTGFWIILFLADYTKTIDEQYKHVNKRSFFNKHKMELVR